MVDGDPRIRLNDERYQEVTTGSNSEQRIHWEAARSSLRPLTESMAAVNEILRYCVDGFESLSDQHRMLLEDVIALRLKGFRIPGELDKVTVEVRRKTFELNESDLDVVAPCLMVIRDVYAPLKKAS